MGIADSVLKGITGRPHEAAQGLLEALAKHAGPGLKRSRSQLRAVDQFVGVEQMARDTVQGVRHPIARLQGKDAPTRMFNGKMVPFMTGEITQGVRVGRLGALGSMKRTAPKPPSLSRLVESKGQGGLVFSGGDIGFDRIAEVAKSGKARGQYVKAEQSAGYAPYVDNESLDRMAALVHPRGERVLVGQPGLHHHDVARGAGLRDYEGWAQMEIRKGNPDFDIPARLFTTNGIGPRPSARQVAATSRFLKQAKGVRYAPMHK